MRGRKLQSFERQLIREGYEAGQTLADLAGAHSVSLRSVAQILGDDAPRGRRRLTGYEKRLIERLAFIGVSCRAIVRETNLSMSAVWRHLAVRGILQPKKRIGQQTAKKIKELKRLGFSNRAITWITGVGYSTVCRVNQTRTFHRLSQDEVDNLVTAFDNGASIKQASRASGRDIATIKRLFDRICEERAYGNRVEESKMNDVLALRLTPEQDARRKEVRRSLGLE